MLLFKNMARSSLLWNSLSVSTRRAFATTAMPNLPQTSITDVKEIFKTDYVVEFDQGLTEEQKKKMKRFEIYRSNPNDPSDRPKYVSYYLDMKKCGPMFLDALIKIKDEIDPTLSFRRSCREGICGSCAMNIDGRNHLACICAVDKSNTEKSTISPLMFMLVLKDLVVDMTHFYAQYKSIDPYLKRKTPKAPGQKEFY